MFGWSRSFWFGVTLPFEAGRVILKHPLLIFWSLVPIAITAALYGFVILRLENAIAGALTHQLSVWGWDAQGWAATLVTILTKILLLLAGVVTFSFVASVAASPFNDFLAEAAEKWGTPPLPPVEGQGVGVRFLAHKARLIAIDISKTLAATIAGIAALFLSWIPGVNVIAFAVAFLLIAFQYISYPQTRRGQGLGDGSWFLIRHPFACAGFGAITSLLFSIPFVSFLSLPLAVVGGTLLVARAAGGKSHGLFPLK